MSLDYFRKRKERKVLAVALLAGIVLSSLAYLASGIVGRFPSPTVRGSCCIGFPLSGSLH